MWIGSDGFTVLRTNVGVHDRGRPQGEGGWEGTRKAWIDAETGIDALSASHAANQT
jgi:hypothetical protein